MKTVLDAVIEFKGEWPFISGFMSIPSDDNDVSEQGKLRAAPSKHTNECWVNACHRDEFNSLVDELASNFGECDISYQKHCSNEVIRLEGNEMKTVTHECWYQVDGGEVFSWETGSLSDTHFWDGACWEPEQLTANNEDNVIFTPRPEVNPVYTQEMHEAGELPSVGMECLTKYKHQDDTMWLSCFIVGLNKDGDYLVFEHTIRGLDQHHIKDGVYDFKPLTTPVKLIDGKAYQFNARGYQYCGIYNEDRKILNVDQGQWFDVVAVTNIQPLKVEK
ncbi:MAG: hypothetical protein GY787_31710 [Alteromonadales bacterium]|nr:hypothetical protein [Alteromonadales bacterium]